MKRLRGTDMRVKRSIGRSHRPFPRLSRQPADIRYEMVLFRWWKLHESFRSEKDIANSCENIASRFTVAQVEVHRETRGDGNIGTEIRHSFRDTSEGKWKYRLRVSGICF